MKLKYYLRGLGIGIIVSTVVLMISFSMKKNQISDEDVIARATQLGMIMPEDVTSDTESNTTEQMEQQVPQEENEGQGATDTPLSDDGQEISNTEEIGMGDNVPAGTDAAENGQTPEDTAVPFRLQINKGDVARNVSETLAANGVVDDAEAFRIYLSQTGYASFMSVGNYDIPYQLTYEEIARILMAGPIEEP